MVKNAIHSPCSVSSTAEEQVRAKVEIIQEQPRVDHDFNDNSQECSDDKSVIEIQKPKDFQESKEPLQLSEEQLSDEFQIYVCDKKKCHIIEMPEEEIKTVLKKKKIKGTAVIRQEA